MFFTAEVAKDAEKGVNLGVSTASIKAIRAVSRPSTSSGQAGPAGLAQLVAAKLKAKTEERLNSGGRCDFRYD